MSGQITAIVDDDLYDWVCEEHNATGKSKSQVVNEYLRDAYQHANTEDRPTRDDSIIPVFGQSLFIAGFVVAAFDGMIAGVGMSLLGLALFIGAKVDAHMAEYDVSPGRALIQVLGA